MTDIQDAVAALRDGSTPAKDLMDIAYAHPELGAQVAGHPNAYPGLLDWLRQYGTPEAKQAVAGLTRPQPPASPARDMPPAASPAVDTLVPDARTGGHPSMLWLLSLLGIVWLVLYYVAGDRIWGIKDLGQWNFVIGIVLFLGPLIASTYQMTSRRHPSPAQEASVTAAAPAVPLYVMATMPDGSQQMVQVAQSSLSLGGTNPDDAPSGGFATLGFFIPMVGLILFLMWKDQTPLKARSAGKGALAGVITSVGLTILIYVVMFVVLANLG